MLIALAYIQAHWRESLIAALIALVLAYVAFQAVCGESRLDKRIDDRTGQQVGVNAEIDGKLEEVKQAEVTTKQAKREREQARKPRKNVTIEEANRNRCIAFPEDCR